MDKDLFCLDSYQFDLPPELIAQHPEVRRDQSRLLHIDRKSGSISEMKFRDLEDFLESSDSLIFNDTKVIPAKLIGQKLNGGKAEFLLVKRLSEDVWEAMARPGKKLKKGTEVLFGKNFACIILETLESGNKIVQFKWDGDFERVLHQYGQLPLPQYIKRENTTTNDRARYQTVYAKHYGAIAAPTAGLHFSEEMLKNLEAKGVLQTSVTLHVGVGTFKPVQTVDIRSHLMHMEQFIISPEAARQLNNRNREKRQICVGTTSCRALESASNEEGVIQAGCYQTNIFIYPGYKFKYVDKLLTNFHLPGSSLLMLVCAFAGYELTMEAYSKAIKDKFRFFSYGDAMLIT